MKVLYLPTEKSLSYTECLYLINYLCGPLCKKSKNY
jgi:hypothetical protein